MWLDLVLTSFSAMNNNSRQLSLYIRKNKYSWNFFKLILFLFFDSQKFLPTNFSKFMLRLQIVYFVLHCEFYLPNDKHTSFWKTLLIGWAVIYHLVDIIVKLKQKWRWSVRILLFCSKKMLAKCLGEVSLALSKGPMNSTLSISPPHPPL